LGAALEPGRHREKREKIRGGQTIAVGWSAGCEEFHKRIGTIDMDEK